MAERAAITRIVRNISSRNHLVSGLRGRSSRKKWLGLLSAKLKILLVYVRGAIRTLEMPGGQILRYARRPKSFEKLCAKILISSCVYSGIFSSWFSYVKGAMSRSPVFLLPQNRAQISEYFWSLISHCVGFLTDWSTLSNFPEIYNPRGDCLIDGVWILFLPVLLISLTDWSLLARILIDQWSLIIDHLTA